MWQEHIPGENWSLGRIGLHIFPLLYYIIIDVLFICRMRDSFEIMIQHTDAMQGFMKFMSSVNEYLEQQIGRLEGTVFIADREIGVKYCTQNDYCGTL
jgi:hypothetical protein